MYLKVKFLNFFILYLFTKKINSLFVTYQIILIQIFGLIESRSFVFYFISLSSSIEATNMVCDNFNPLNG